MDETYLALYRSIHDVMRAEAALKRSEIPCKLVPVPTSVRSDCGMALSVLPEAYDPAMRALGSARALPEAVYRRDASGHLREVSPA